MAAPKLIPLAAYARMMALLSGRAGRVPLIASEARQIMTGMEARVVTVRAGGATEKQTYMGPSMTGVGPAALRAERQRLIELEQAVKAARAELEGVLKVTGG